MDLLGRLAIKFEVDLSDLDDAGSRLKSVGSNFVQLGAIVTAGVTVPITGLGVAALTSAIQFETAMTKIAKTVDAPAPAIAALGESLKDLSESTGTSVIELARIAEIAGQMGIAAEDIDDFTEIIAALGVATELSTDAAAEGLAKFSNVMGTSIDDVDRLGSALVALGNAGSSSEAAILEMAQRITAAGNQVGLAESEVLAFASALSDLGIDAEAGGSAISKLFFNMQADVATGGGALEQFAKVAHLSVADFSDLFRRDAAGAVLAFVKGLGSMDKTSGEAIVALDEMGIKEVRLRNAVLSLAAGTDTLTAALDVGAKGWAENTALMDEASKFYASTGQQLEGLKNKAVNVASELGAALLPAFNELIDVASGFLDFVRKIVDGFGQLPAPIQTGIVAFAGLLAAWGPLLVIGGGLLTLWGTMAVAAALLSTTVGVIAAAFFGIPAAIAVVIAAGVAVVKNWDAIKDGALDLITTVGSKFSAWASTLVKAWDAIKAAASGLAATVTERFQALASAVSTAFSALATRLEVLTEPLQHLGRAFVDLGDAIGDVLAAIATRIGQILSPALALMGKLFRGAVDAVTSTLQGLAGFIGNVLSGIATAVGNVLGAVADKISSLLGGAFDLMGDLFAAGRDAIVLIVVGMVDRILDSLGPLGRLVDFVARGVEGVTKLFRAAADEIVGHSIVPDMIKAIGSEFNKLEPLMVGPTKAATSATQQAFNALSTDGITGVFANAATHASEIMTGLLTNVTTNFGNVEKAMVVPVQRAAEAVNEAFKSIVSPKAINHVDFKVSIDPSQLYASLIAAGQTTSQKLQLIAAASTGLEAAFQNQLEAAQNEHDVRVAATEAIAAQTRRQELLAIVVGDNTEAYKRDVTAVSESTVRHNALAHTLQLANESTQHLTATQFSSASTIERALSGAGDLVGRAGDNLKGSFDVLKGGALDLLQQFTPMGIATQVVQRAFEKLEPVLRPFQAIIEILADVLAAAIVPVLRILFPIIKLIAEAFTFAGEIVYRVAQGFLLVIGNVVRAIGKLIDALPFVSGKGIINAGEALLNQADAMGDAARAMREARDALIDLSFDGTVEVEDNKETGDFGVGEALGTIGEQIAAGTTDQVAATDKVGDAVKDNAKQTEAAVIAIKEEAGVLTKMLLVLGDIRTAIGQLGGFTPVETVTTTALGPTMVEWPAGLQALLALAQHEEAAAQLGLRAALASEDAALAIREESAVLTQQLEVQVQIREGIYALTATLEAKDFAPTIVVGDSGAPSDGGTLVLPRGTDGTDRDLADNFDRQGRYDGDDFF